MNSLLKSIRSGIGGRDPDIKDSLISRLSTCVKDIQVEHADPDSNDRGCAEAVNALCTTLEALFIHGLKDSFLQKVSQAVLSEFDARPDPNFWCPLLIVSHRDVIKQVMDLNLIQTDVGRCRAWLRLALNEGVLSSYLEAMRRDGQQALSHYYKRSAMLRDSELIDVAQRLLDGLGSFPFNLPLNTSLLNMWTVQPLLLAGLWTPPMRAAGSRDVVGHATDAAEALEKDDKIDLPADSISIASDVSHQCASPIHGVNEEAALKVILDMPVDETAIFTPQPVSKGEVIEKILPPAEIPIQSEYVDVSQTSVNETASDKEKQEEESMSALGNSLSSRLGWSSSFEESDSGLHPTDENERAILKRKSRSKAASVKQKSYYSILKSYNTASPTTSTPPDFDAVLQNFQTNASSSPAGSVRDQDDLSYPQELGFEIIDSSPESEITDLHNLLHVTKLPRELGLDVQNYVCFGCDEPIGFNFGAARLCGLSGRYFCNACTAGPGEECIIPARIIFNWDFHRCCVSKRAAVFLNNYHLHPIINLKKINPSLYLAVEEVAELKKIRNQLNLLWLYLSTCREPVIGELRKMVWPREYLYERTHIYSIFDLTQIPSGVLKQLLNGAVSFAREHVYSCVWCSLKGFVCEICGNPRVIYPFDLEHTYRCKECGTTFHATCQHSGEPCRKCERRKKRERALALDVCVESFG